MAEIFTPVNFSSHDEKYLPTRCTSDGPSPATVKAATETSYVAQFSIPTEYIISFESEIVETKNSREIQKNT